MIKLDIRAPINYTDADLRDEVVRCYPVERGQILDIGIVRRTLITEDKGDIHYKMTLALSLPPEKEEGMLKMKKKVSPYAPYDVTIPTSRFKDRPYVVGSGPCGLFCALILAESGARPIVLERGSSVEKRAEKVRLFNTYGILDTECNIQFGEGGAGTYSDGKLKFGSMDALKYKILTELRDGGGDGDILFSSTAHLGTDKLPTIVKKIREKIIALGGEFMFDTRLSDIKIKDGRIVGLSYVQDGSETTVDTSNVFLAVGHSARDVFTMLAGHGVRMEAKPFGVGMRIEHPREYVDALVYGKNAPAGIETASYHLVTHLDNGRSVYSFCMCPGGSVVAATSNERSVVTNGMSEYSRMADNSNSALLVSVFPSDFGTDDPLGGFVFQRVLEERAYSLSGDYVAPATRLDDFLRGDTARAVYGSVRPSYPRGTSPVSPEKYLPDVVTSSLRAGILDFEKWMPGFALPDAVLTGVEGRSTSPVRILRDENFEAQGIEGLYPIGEGAGYSGGIVSSAYDGARCAVSVIKNTVTDHP